MKKIGVMLYPHFSLQEVTCLTASLTVWFGEEIDYLAAERSLYKSEDGFLVMPSKTFDEVEPSAYDCLILPGIIDPFPALFNDQNILFLKKLQGADTIIAAISSAPLLLAKAGLLDETKFTAGFFMQMTELVPFIKTENFVHRPVMEDRNIITGIGFAFREFAACVLQRLGFDPGNHFMEPAGTNYTEQELTFYWTAAEYEEVKEELKQYTNSENYPS